MEIQHSRKNMIHNRAFDVNARKRNTVAQICVVTLMVILLLMVWPFRVFEHSQTSAYDKQAVTQETGAITMEEIVLQPFVPADGHIADLDIEVRTYDVHGQDRVFVTIYNDVFEIVWQEVVYFTDIEALGRIAVSPELDVETGALYYLGMNVHFDSAGVLTAVYANIEELRMAEPDSFIYAGAYEPGCAVLMKFRYAEPFSLGLRILCTMGILFGGIGVYAASVWCMKRISALAQRQKTHLKKGALIAGSVVYLLGICKAFYQLCIARMFGGMALDIGVYAATCMVMLAGGAGLFLTCWKKIMQNSEETIRKNLTLKPSRFVLTAKLQKYTKISLWQDYLQVLAFAFLLYCGIMYVNSSVQWKQDLNGMWVVLLFGIAILVSFRLEDLLHPLNLVWGAIMIPIGICYANTRAHMDHGVQIATVFMVAIFVWGMILMRTIRKWSLRKVQTISRPFVILWLLLCLGTVLFAYGKTWPIMMSVTFSIFFLQYDTEKAVQRVVRNFAHAVLVNFVGVLILCLLYRPYEYYQYNRYPMWFHTVASTGMYLALVQTVALVRLYMKMKQTRTIFCGCVKEWIFHSVVMAYIAFAVARTTLMSVCGIIFILCVATIVTERVSWKRYVQALGVFALMLLVSVPVCYTATRCIPAVVNQPYHVVPELEDFDEAVKEGDEPDSYRYMNVKALMRLWGERFGWPEFMKKPFEDEASVQTDMLRVISLGELVSGSVDGTELAAVIIENEPTSKVNELSNGRIEIFKRYLKELNWTGHKSMVYTDEEGTLIAHSHNSFIQMAYDFGIFTGIVSLGLCLFAIGRAVVLIWTGRNRSEAMYVSLLIFSTYLITSISEYTANPHMPLGFAYLFLFITMRTDKNVVK